MHMLQINYFSTSLVKLFSLAATRLSPLLSVKHYFSLCFIRLYVIHFIRFSQKSTEIPPLKGEPLTCIHTLSAASNFPPSQNSRLYKPVSWHWQGAQWQGLQIRATMSHKFEISSRNIRRCRTFSLTL